MKSRLILEELAARNALRFRAEDVCFDEQLKFIRDTAKYSTAVCTRRAGKTIACAVDLCETARQNPGVVCLYITLARTNAKKLIWPELLKLNRNYRLGAKADNTELSLTFPNGSVIYCSGAKDKSEIEKFRGLPIKKVYIDEAQSMRSHIEDLIDDVLAPALLDYDGQLRLIGTPGPVPAGYFYEVTQHDAWSHHFWTLFQNPHLEKKSGKPPKVIVMEEIKRRGVDVNDPKIQREFFGRWVTDTDSLVIKYQEHCHFDALPVYAKPWNYVISIDVGHDDADAIAVIAFHDHDKAAYLVHESIKPKQGITELANEVKNLMMKYDPLKIVMDTGGLGKKIAKELQVRQEIPIVAAEKTRKVEYIEILNDALRTGTLRAKKNSAFAQDSYLLEWDRDKQTPDKKVISDRYHSDIIDAVLYGYRECLNWLSTPAPPPRPKPHTPEYYDEEERKILAALEDQYLKKEGDIWEDALTDYANEDF